MITITGVMRWKDNALLVTCPFFPSSHTSTEFPHVGEDTLVRMVIPAVRSRIRPHVTYHDYPRESERHTRRSDQENPGTSLHKL